MAVQEAHADVDVVLGESMIEEIRRTAEDRLRQIEPLIEEAHRLRDVLEVIERRSVTEITLTGVGGAPHANGSSSVTSVAPRAAKGSNKRVILELVGRRPGITVAEITEVTGMKRTVAASTVSRLKRHGELRAHEHGGVRLPQAGL